MIHNFYFPFPVCEGDEIILGGLCCNAAQVNDHGECKDECSDDRPVEIDGVCGCAADLVGKCAQENQRKENMQPK